MGTTTKAAVLCAETPGSLGVAGGALCPKVMSKRLGVRGPSLHLVASRVSVTLGNDKRGRLSLNLRVFRRCVSAIALRFHGGGIGPSKAGRGKL